MRDSLAKALATWFGCGYSPVGPGTVGAIAAVLIAAALHTYAGWSGLSIGMAGLLLTLPGVWASHIYAKNAGREDPGEVVIDEVAGQLIAVGGAIIVDWKGLLGAFLLFRLFDIWKPSPVREFEQFPGGIGIMADDVMAGVYASLVLALTRWLNVY
jgi:phosphatidylglycerophosphatase A